MKKLLIAAVAVLTMTSCSTVVNGKTQSFKVRSQNNQRILVKDTYGNVIKQGNGQLELNLAKSNGAFSGATYTIESNNDKVIVTPKLNIGAFLIGNFFVPGFWGYLVDGLTGAMYDLEVNGQYTNEINLK